MVHDPVVFTDDAGLVDYICDHADGFVYAVGGVVHYIAAALGGAAFGVFGNHPGKRNDGSFGLATVHHVRDGKLVRVWVNADPNADEGEALIPVAR